MLLNNKEFNNNKKFMKKLTFPLLALVLGATTANAQTSDYNKWSIDVNFGSTKPTNPFATGYYADTFFSLPHADAGVRYMFNNKFGLKADFGYDYIKQGETSAYFRQAAYRTSLQGVANLGRILNFEEWTKVFNVQFHLGGGYSWTTPVDGKVGGISYDKDQTGHIITGITGQVKLGKRAALNADFTMVNFTRKHITWDGTAYTDRNADRAFNASLYNATVGLSFYLGGNGEHADWYANDDLTNRVTSLESRVSDIENKMLDSDNDGVADYLDLEPNTPLGNIVDVKGRSIDLNKNGIPDSYEAYFAQNYGGTKSNAPLTQADSNTVKGLINDGYVAVYFDFDKSQPKNVESIDFILTYLKSNPNASVEVLGYADSIGSTSYNNRLSEKRAKNVAKILEQAGISSSRLTVRGEGENTSIDGRNKSTARFAREDPD